MTSGWGGSCNRPYCGASLSGLIWAQIQLSMRAYSYYSHCSQSSGLLRMIVVDKLNIGRVILTNRQIGIYRQDYPLIIKVEFYRVL